MSIQTYLLLFLESTPFTPYFGHLIRRFMYGKDLCIQTAVDAGCDGGHTELHRDLDVPDVDILVNAGDFSQFALFSQSDRVIADFDRWLGELPHRHKIVVPGNHEFVREKLGSSKTALHNARLLINEGVRSTAYASGANR